MHFYPESILSGSEARQKILAGGMQQQRLPEAEEKPANAIRLPQSTQGAVPTQGESPYEVNHLWKAPIDTLRSVLYFSAKCQTKQMIQMNNHNP